MTLASYERTTRTLAILIVLTSIALWIYVFHSILEIAVQFASENSCR